MTADNVNQAPGVSSAGEMMINGVVASLTRKYRLDRAQVAWLV